MNRISVLYIVGEESGNGRESKSVSYSLRHPKIESRSTEFHATLIGGGEGKIFTGETLGKVESNVTGFIKETFGEIVTIEAGNN